MTAPTRTVPVRELEVGERMDMFDGYLLITAVTPCDSGVRVDFADGSAVTLPVGANVRILGAGL